MHEASVGRSSGRWGGGERASKGWLVNSRRAHTHEPGSWLCIWRGIVSTLHTNELHQDVSFSRWTDHASKWVCCAQRAGPLRTTCGIRRCCCERDCEALSLFSIVKKKSRRKGFACSPFFLYCSPTWFGSDVWHSVCARLLNAPSLSRQNKQLNGEQCKICNLECAMSCSRSFSDIIFFFPKNAPHVLSGPRQTAVSMTGRREAHAANLCDALENNTQTDHCTFREGNT